MKTDLANLIIKKGKGRHTALKEALANGNLHQPGLMQAVVFGLADGDTAFANFIAEEVIPAYGKVAAPLIVAALHANGKSPDERRLAALRRIDPEEARKAARLCLAAKHDYLVKEAIRCLAGSPHDAAAILPFMGLGSSTQGKRRTSIVREAVFEALHGNTADDVVGAVTEAFEKRIPEVSQSIEFTNDPRYDQLCLESLAKLWKTAEQGNDLTKEEAEALEITLRCCQGRGGSELDDLLLGWLKHWKKGGLKKSGDGLGGYHIQDELCGAIATCDVPKAQRELVAARNRVETVFRARVMGAASWHDDLSLYDLFHDHLSKRLSSDSYCYRWACGERWNCTVLGTVKAALDIDFEAPGCDNKPMECQKDLVNKIRKDPRWRAAVDAEILKSGAEPT